MLSDAQEKPLSIFAQKILQGRDLNAKLMGLTKKLKATNINRILEKDDFELGLDFLINNKK